MLPNLGFHELLIFGTIAIVLFGKRLPEVARSLGSTYRQFREGLADFQRQMDVTNMASTTTTTRWTPPAREPEDRQAPTAPKFEPPAALGGPSAVSTTARSTTAAATAEAGSAVTSSAPELGSISSEAAQQS
ncbi:MAG: twin-arginine translocase TatA/TatE family subunit [Pirellulales bacterium]